MEPSFHDGDKVLVWKVPRFIDRIADGDVILFEEYVGTNHTGRIDIKRVKAIPGEYIQFHRNGVNITKLGIDEYYVLGDNADVSYDSRFFGPIHRKQIIGVVVK
jgi:type IV secretory pathway protease TraF